MGTSQSKIEALRDRITDVQDQNPDDTLCPIEGLARTPLMSLAEATAGLDVMVPNIHEYVKSTQTLIMDKPLPDGVSIDGLAAIIIYTIEWETDKTLSLYHHLNRSLRKESRTSLKPYLPYLKLFLTTLRTLPSYKGSVWRGIRKNIANDYPTGKQFYWWAINSCTKDISTLENEKYLGKTGKRTLFNIQCKNGKEIWQWSVVKHEQEIILLPGTFLEVKSCLDLGHDTFIIELEEIDSHTPSIETALQVPNVIKVTKEKCNVANKKVNEKNKIYNEILIKMKNDHKNMAMYLSAIPTAVNACDENKNHAEIINLVIKYLEVNNNENLIEAACIALASLASTIKSKYVIKNEKGLEKMIKAMNLYCTNEYILHQGFCVISQFLKDDKDMLLNYVLDLMGDFKGLSVIVKTLEYHQEVENLVKYICSLVSSLSVHKTSIIQSFVHHGVVTLLLDVLPSHQLTIALSCLKALRNLSVSEIVRKSIESSNADKQLSAAMNQHIGDEEFQNLGCETFMNITANDVIASNVIQSGAVNNVVQAMDVHTLNPSVQVNGCWALYNFARIPTNCSYIVTSGGLKCIVNAMTTHIEKHEVQDKACRALAMVCATTETCAVVLKQSLNFIITAMLNHQENVQVMKNACFALTNLSTDELNKETIASKDNVLNLVLNAMYYSVKKSTADLLKYSLSTLVKLALTNSGQKFLGEANSINTMLAMIKELKDHNVVRDLCLIMVSLCRDKGSRERIVRASGEETIKAVIEQSNEPTRRVAQKLLVLLQQRL